MNKLVVFLDCETDNLVNKKKRWDDPCQPHILSIGCVAWTADGKQEVFSYYTLIKPDTFTIDNNCEACKVNGLTHEMCSDYGIKYAAAVLPIEHICHRAWRVVIYNSAFEAALFEIERYRFVRKTHPFGPEKTRCLMLHMASIIKEPSPWANGEYKWQKFGAAYKFIFGEEPAEQHHALHDARNSAYLTFALQDAGMWDLNE